MGRLDVRIVEAKNLPNTETFGKPDPYVVLTIENTTHKTSVVDGTLNPKWDEVFKFVVADPDSAQLVMKLWNKNMVSDDYMGEYKMNLSGLTKGEVKDTWCLLQQCKAQGELRVRLVAHDFGADPVPGAAATAAAGAGAPMPAAVQQQQQQYPLAYPQMPAMPMPAAGYPAMPPWEPEPVRRFEQWTPEIAMELALDIGINGKKLAKWLQAGNRIPAFDYSRITDPTLCAWFLACVTQISTQIYKNPREEMRFRAALLRIAYMNSTTRACDLGLPVPENPPNGWGWAFNVDEDDEEEEESDDETSSSSSSSSSSSDDE